MPTPTQAFLNVAGKHGIDPSDPQAVQRWFSEDLPALPIEQIEEILEELLAYDANGEDSPGARHYPEGIQLPLLKKSPAAPTPLLAVRWRELLRTLIGRLRDRTGK